MATHHAAPGEVIDLKTWASDLPLETSKAIAKTDQIEMIRLFLQEGESFPTNIIPGPAIFHCISGSIELNGTGQDRRITTGQLLYLASVEQDWLKAKIDSVVLMIIILCSHASH